MDMLIKIILDIFVRISDKHRLVSLLSFGVLLLLNYWVGLLIIKSIAFGIVWLKSDVDPATYAVSIAAGVGLVVMLLTYWWCSVVNSKIDKHILTIIDVLEKQLTS